MRIVYLPTADRDLVEIYTWIGRADPQAANRYIDKIRASLWRLRAYPESGPERRDVAPTARSLSVASHIVLYRIADGNVEIVRVVHGARDMRAFAEDFA